MTHSAQFGAQMATRSPRSMPLATMARVAAATCSASSSKVRRVVVPPGPCTSTRASASPEAGGGVLHQTGDGPPLEIPAGIGHI